MRTKSLISAITAAALMLAVSASANAQLGNLLNKAKDKAQNAIGNTVKNATGTGSQTATPSVSNSVSAVTMDLTNNNPLPWPMDLKESYDLRKKVQDYVMNLNKENEQSVKGLKQQLLDRHARNQEIINKYKDVRKDGQLQFKYDDVVKEDELFDNFFFILGQSHATLMTMNGEVDLANNKASINSCQVSSQYSTLFVYGDKPTFHNMSGDQVYIEGEDKAEVQKNMVQLYYIIMLCDGVQNENAAQTKTKAYMCLDCIGNAIENNKPENMERHPLPQGSSLNSSLASSALAAAKQNSGYKDAKKAVITTDWAIERDALGNIIRRKCDGVVVCPDKFGDKACKVQWAEEYMGGGKYGNIKLHGIGMGVFYIK